MLKHIPVMLNEVIDSLNLKKGNTVVDATVGAGGHSAEILKHIKGGKLFCLDRDEDAINFAEVKLLQSGEFVRCFHTNFENIADLGLENVDAITADFGVSSYQIDTAERGFSYMKDGKLDMRMDRNDAITASDIVNTFAEKKIENTLREFGGETYSKQIAAAIVKARPIYTTLQLSNICKHAVPESYHKFYGHPAKKTFQAIRIVVNEELKAIEKFLDGAIKVLKPGGRLAVLTFHSLEDRIVKHKFMRENIDCLCDKNMPQCICSHKASIKIVTKHPIEPSVKEVMDNPRSASARLRVIEKLK